MMFTIKRTQVFDDWLKTLKDAQARGAIAARVQRLTQGLSGDVKPVGSGISELRIHVGKGYRVYFKRSGKQIVVLLCGGNKKTQNQDIERAKELVQYLDL
ncbi:TPA: type II toxin-antitoxin system RelE/ParE family toxin [Vibrio cholerae]